MTTKPNKLASRRDFLLIFEFFLLLTLWRERNLETGRLKSYFHRINEIMRAAMFQKIKEKRALWSSRAERWYDEGSMPAHTHTHKNNVYLRIESEMSLEMGINDFIC